MGYQPVARPLRRVKTSGCNPPYGTWHSGQAANDEHQSQGCAYDKHPMSRPQPAGDCLVRGITRQGSTLVARPYQANSSPAVASPDSTARPL